MLVRDKILLSTQAHAHLKKKKIYSATASGTCLSTNGYRMITLPHSVMCHDFCESQQQLENFISFKHGPGD